MAFEPRGPSNKKKSLFTLVYFYSLCWVGWISIHFYACMCMCILGGGGEENSAPSTHTPKTTPAIFVFFSTVIILFSRARVYKIDRHNPIRWWLWCGVGICVCVMCGCWPTFGGIRSLGRWNNNPQR